MSKLQFIADYAVGDEVRSLFLIGAAQQGQAKNGPYWRLDLRDSSGSIEAKIWSPQCQMYPALAAGDIAAVDGRISRYRERLEIAVERLRVLEEHERTALDLALFLPCAARPASEMLAELVTLCKKTLTHGPWKKMVLGILNDPDVAALLPGAPAAKAMHHAYAGGLLEHTLAVARLCMTFADAYPDLDRQALLAGAVCHDLGKLWEMTQGLATDYTGEGKLLGHIQILLDKIAPYMRKAGLEEELALHFKHLVLSHHGRHEFGSPRLPASMEAIALHFADDLDAKLNQARTALECVPAGESGWSPYIPSLERALFKAPPTPEPPPCARHARNAGRRGAPSMAVTAGDGETPDAVPGQLSLLGGS